MLTITVTTTDVEEKALKWMAVDPQVWAENFIKQRALIAMNEIYDMEVARMRLDPEITSIPVNIEEVVLAADIQTAAERMATLPTPPLP
jgi:hypothetical protein